ncbi:hypothetical protein BDY21DRAFT_411900 [Lineolata rhizophorae]|uniref:Uncharacterized protein n=1 Tax=Lineolata rhizophorae TaxID=578093 RepID=A0A6A6P2T8_9PEZI|nr:hypothetical protein BDY21DRAFT_411900 [Lineolata rhizophorae]
MQRHSGTLHGGNALCGKYSNLADETQHCVSAATTQIAQMTRREDENHAVTSQLEHAYGSNFAPGFQTVQWPCAGIVRRESAPAGPSLSQGSPRRGRWNRGQAGRSNSMEAPGGCAMTTWRNSEVSDDAELVGHAGGAVLLPRRRTSFGTVQGLKDIAAVAASEKVSSARTIMTM